ncbi:MAG: FHA domain-containing protein [Smithellaceae bacterium]|jgi:pSer/pThr/pTyr-binding forkhead associated (FHA) protein|nr:FHA domain-containing protein [Smithellaceae bacterium]MDD3259828.1 FHA domain-containing protein [Smithellaceae bacterium]MDD3848163.1 FHA domain-containing protein [Smithellaceae bacterium]HOQ72083.1 FHA domain-containing protein [Smithellaceae bacterium]HPL10317.1 FHA domain-containing protein [Smithellaceae bacterium]
MAKILLKYKEAAVKEIPLDKESTTIGRKPDNDIVIDNQAVSGHHASITVEGDKLMLEDLGSLNGTFVNGQKISKTELFNGDVVLIGVHTLNVTSEKNRSQETKGFAVRGRSMDETMVIAPDDQKKIVAAADKNLPEPLGGFMVVEGSTEKKEYELKERVSSIGKEDGSAVKLKGLFAPKLAALVNRRKEGYFITPAGGKELKVNGKTIDRRCDLKDGDLVEVANLKLQFYLKE